MDLQPYNSNRNRGGLFSDFSDFSMMPFGGRNDPFQMINRDINQMNQMMPHHLPDPQQEMRQMRPILNADLIDCGDRFEIHCDLPGVSKEDLDVSIDNVNYTMTIRGERKHVYQEGPEEGQSSGRRQNVFERTYGTVSRTLKIPKNCDLSNAQCALANGVLQVTFPKTADKGDDAVKKLRVN